MGQNVPGTNLPKKEGKKCTGYKISQKRTGTKVTKKFVLGSFFSIIFLTKFRVIKLPKLVLFFMRKNSKKC